MNRTLRTLRAPPSPLPLVDVDALRDFVKGKPVEPSDAGSEPPARMPSDVSGVDAPADTAPQEPISAAPARAPRMFRVHFNTRLPQDVEQALRRVSLQRKLDDVWPHSIQDITEEAFRAWLDSHGN